MPAPYDLSREELTELLEGEPAYRSRQVWDGLHARAQRPEEMTELPAALRAELEAALPAALHEVSRRSADGGETTKWLWALHDGARVETVLMHYPDRVTVCVSTQAGCAMACQFCATGQAGFQRHLMEGEIVEQVAVAMREARPRRLSNVVFMGMGEPLLNVSQVTRALDLLEEEVSPKRTTVSTAGVVPGIESLAGRPHRPNLAVSLSGADDSTRTKLMPINRTYPLAELFAALKRWPLERGRKITFEYVLIEGVNDTSADAVKLAALVRTLPAKVNLIPLNESKEWLPGLKRPSDATVNAFAKAVVGGGVPVTVRWSKGLQADAACGQLKGREEPRRPRSR
jgi:23S rRNA (adenine2503-C2)-methyltransferase